MPLAEDALLTYFCAAASCFSSVRRDTRIAADVGCHPTVLRRGRMGGEKVGEAKLRQEGQYLVGSRSHILARSGGQVGQCSLGHGMRRVHHRRLRQIGDASVSLHGYAAVIWPLYTYPKSQEGGFSTAVSACHIEVAYLVIMLMTDPKKKAARPGNHD